MVSSGDLVLFLLELLCRENSLPHAPAPAPAPADELALPPANTLLPVLLAACRLLLQLALVLDALVPTRLQAMEEDEEREVAREQSSLSWPSIVL